MSIIQTLSSHLCKIFTINILSKQAFDMTSVTRNMLLLELVCCATYPSYSILDMSVIRHVFRRIHEKLYLLYDKIIDKLICQKIIKKDSLILQITNNKMIFLKYHTDHIFCIYGIKEQLKLLNTLNFALLRKVYLNIASVSFKMNNKR